MRSNHVIQRNLDYFEQLKHAVRKDAYEKIARVWKRKLIQLSKNRMVEAQAKNNKKSTNKVTAK